MKPEDKKFDVGKFKRLFANSEDEKLSTEAVLIKYGYISGYIQGLYADKRIQAYFKDTKNFQASLERVLMEDWKKFRSEIKF